MHDLRSELGEIKASPQSGNSLGNRSNNDSYRGIGLWKTSNSSFRVLPLLPEAAELRVFNIILRLLGFKATTWQGRQG